MFASRLNRKFEGADFARVANIVVQVGIRSGGIRRRGEYTEDYVSNPKRCLRSYGGLYSAFVIRQLPYSRKQRPGEQP
jgi:hypothetical protein